MFTFTSFSVFTSLCARQGKYPALATASPSNCCVCGSVNHANCVSTSPPLTHFPLTLNAAASVVSQRFRTRSRARAFPCPAGPFPLSPVAAVSLQVSQILRLVGDTVLVSLLALSLPFPLWFVTSSGFPPYLTLKTHFLIFRWYKNRRMKECCIKASDVFRPLKRATSRVGLPLFTVRHVRARACPRPNSVHAGEE